jgi:hypothetical protein
MIECMIMAGFGGMAFAGLGIGAFFASDRAILKQKLENAQSGFKSIGEYCTDLEQRLTALGHSPQAQPIVGHGHQALSPRDLKRAVTDRFYKVINEDETGRVYVGVDLENHVEVVVNCTEGGMDAWSSFTIQTDAELHELIDALMDANFKAKGQ